MKFLLIDDELSSLKKLEEAVSEASPEDEIFSFKSPLEALAFAEKTRVDAVFTDIEMDEMNGILLVKNLKSLMPGIGVIICTSSTDFALEAFRLRASGYILKPVSAADIRQEIDALSIPRYIPQKNNLVIKTFGNFEVLLDEKPVKFIRSKSKEVFAYLVDCRGTSATASEIASIIWEDGTFDRSRQKQLQKIISDLRKSLKAINADDVIIKSLKGYLIDKSKVDCDYYRLLDGDKDIAGTYTGKYMNSYSWAELTTAYLNRIVFELHESSV